MLAEEELRNIFEKGSNFRKTSNFSPEKPNEGVTLHPIVINNYGHNRL
jgi:hypothetical protein